MLTKVCKFGMHGYYANVPDGDRKENKMAEEVKTEETKVEETKVEEVKAEEPKVEKKEEEKPMKQHKTIGQRIDGFNAGVAKVFRSKAFKIGAAVAGGAALITGGVALGKMMSDNVDTCGVEGYDYTQDESLIRSEEPTETLADSFDAAPGVDSVSTF